MFVVLEVLVLFVVFDLVVESLVVVFCFALVFVAFFEFDLVED